MLIKWPLWIDLGHFGGRGGERRGRTRMGSEIMDREGEETEVV